MPLSSNLHPFARLIVLDKHAEFFTVSAAGDTADSTRKSDY